jgi:hypothetical protein
MRMHVLQACRAPAVVGSVCVDQAAPTPDVLVLGLAI